MNKKTKGLVAGVAGGALLLGAGGTFALWSDVAALGQARIESGQLDIDALPMSWWDVSPDLQAIHDHEGTGPAFAIEDTGWAFWAEEGRRLEDPISRPDALNPGFRTVPGDHLTGHTTITLAFEGDNLRVRLSLTPETILTGSDFIPENILIRGALFDIEGDQVGEPLWVGDASAPLTLDHRQLELLDEMDGPDGRVTLHLRTDFEFLDVADVDTDGINQYDMNSVLDLGELPLSITQVRADQN